MIARRCDSSRRLLGARRALLKRKRQAERALRPLACHRLFAGLKRTVECRSEGLQLQPHVRSFSADGRNRCAQGVLVDAIQRRRGAIRRRRFYVQGKTQLRAVDVKHAIPITVEPDDRRPRVVRAEPRRERDQAAGWPTPGAKFPTSAWSRSAMYR